MSNNIKKKVLALFEKLNGAMNTYNDPINRAGVVIAITNCMISALDPLNKMAKDEIKEKFIGDGPGTNRALIAERGVAVALRINNGASRLDAKQLTPAILKAGWKGKNGKALTLSEITEMVDSCKKAGEPSMTITSSIVDTMTDNGSK